MADDERVCAAVVPICRFFLFDQQSGRAAGDRATGQGSALRFNLDRNQRAELKTSFLHLQLHLQLLHQLLLLLQLSHQLLDLTLLLVQTFVLLRVLVRGFFLRGTLPSTRSLWGTHVIVIYAQVGHFGSYHRNRRSRLDAFSFSRFRGNDTLDVQAVVKQPKPLYEVSLRPRNR